MLGSVLSDLLVFLSSGEGEVVQACDAEHGVVDAFASETAVAQDLPAVHAGEGVLDAGTDAAVGGIVLLLPGRQALVLVPAVVRDGQAVPR
jgi:hypothetical protein